MDAGPVRDGRARCWAGVRKPPKEETAGRKGADWSGTTYGDLRIADGWGASRRGPVARMLRGGNNDGELIRSRGCAGLARVWRLERMCGPCERNAFLLRGAAEGEEKRRCEVEGAETIIMKCRS